MENTADVSAEFASDDRMTANMALVAAHIPAYCALKAPLFSQWRFVCGDDAAAGVATTTRSTTVQQFPRSFVELATIHFRRQSPQRRLRHRQELIGFTYDVIVAKPRAQTSCAIRTRRTECRRAGPRACCDFSQLGWVYSLTPEETKPGFAVLHPHILFHFRSFIFLGLHRCYGTLRKNNIVMTILVIA
jgi:hypothetical protein